MKIQICPTITASTMDEYKKQIENIQGFAERIHIDLMDGVFTSNRSVDIDDVYWPEDVVADIHLMHERPELVLDSLIRLKPNMVMVHAESKCDVSKFASNLRLHDIKTGLAVLPQTPVSGIEYLLPNIQQVLVFSGNLGYQGGSEVDFSLLDKVKQLKASWNWLEEIAWDGGINSDNINELVEGGVQVLNVGGFIQSNSSPADAYNLIALQVSRT